MTLTDKSTPQRVLDVRFWTETLLSFTLTRPPDYRFVPGQYSRLGLPAESGQMVWRAYSVVSAPGQDLLEYYGVIVPGGLFTSELKRIRPGDTIHLDKHLFGFMTADRFKDGASLWMLATGTGLGPFVSILRDKAVWAQFRHIVLVHGARHADELSYSEELHAMQQRSDGQFRLLQSVTRDDDLAALPAGVMRGRITTLMANGQLEEAAGETVAPVNARVMLCGNPAMIEEMRAQLHARGMQPLRRASPGHFVTENYW
ncbi:MAG: ferredoxin--NADP reductase [Lacisediminimonas sp.]|nr:ferredoxin--NADP reductase [Lacisediminimonas sp.]